MQQYSNPQVPVRKDSVPKPYQPVVVKPDAQTSYIPFCKPAPAVVVVASGLSPAQLLVIEKQTVRKTDAKLTSSLFDNYFA